MGGSKPAFTSTQLPAAKKAAEWNTHSSPPSFPAELMLAYRSQWEDPEAEKGWSWPAVRAVAPSFGLSGLRHSTAAVPSLPSVPWAVGRTGGCGQWHRTGGGSAGDALPAEKGKRGKGGRGGAGVGRRG